MCKIIYYSLMSMIFPSIFGIIASSLKCEPTWQSLPEQLAKENKSLSPPQTQSGAELKDFNPYSMVSSEWIGPSNLRHYQKPNLPLGGYQDNVFKTIFCGCGIIDC